MVILFIVVSVIAIISLIALEREKENHKETKLCLQQKEDASVCLALLQRAFVQEPANTLEIIEIYMSLKLKFGLESQEAAAYYNRYSDNPDFVEFVRNIDEIWGLLRMDESNRQVIQAILVRFVDEYKLGEMKEVCVGVGFKENKPCLVVFCKTDEVKQAMPSIPDEFEGVKVFIEIHKFA
jgi:hypothetical protein